MKRILYIIMFLVLSFYGISQNETDALRYSQNFYYGTARFMGMGGAFGALGGDFTSLSYNPAGLGVYRKSELSFSPNFSLYSSESTFLNTMTTDYKYNFNMNNVGMVLTYKNDDDDNSDGWKNINFGFGYNHLNTFHRNITIQGINKSSSLADYFLMNANGKQEDQLDSFVEYLAWYTYIIDTIPGTTDQYYSALTDSIYGQQQQKVISSKGYIGEYVFSLGANYSHKLYIGGTLGIQSILFRENTIHSEEDINNQINDFQSFDFRQFVKTSGVGFNFKFGMIYRPVEWMRIGAAIHSPTFINLDDSYDNEMKSAFDNGDNYSEESPEGKYIYELTTPFKAIGSCAFMYKQTALISIDYEYIDYSQARLRASDFTFSNENESIRTRFIPVGNIKAGAEYRHGPFSFRGGFGYFTSPYASNDINNNTHYQMYSGGFGVKDKNFYFDIAYSYYTWTEKYYLYFLDKMEPASIRSGSSHVTATFGFRF